MKRLMLCVALAAIAALASGCGSVGTSFNQGNLNQLRLHETTRQEAITLIGEPSEITRVLNEDGDFEMVEYLYAKKGLGGAKVRAVNLEFKDGVLNAYNYVSTFAEDATTYDFSAFESLEISSSTKDDVLRALGKPTGQGFCPSPLLESGCEGSSEVWVWQSFLDAPKNEVLEKTVIISFDKDGVVSNIGAIEEIL